MGKGIARTLVLSALAATIAVIAAARTSDSAGGTPPVNPAPLAEHLNRVAAKLGARATMLSGDARGLLRMAPRLAAIRAAASKAGAARRPAAGSREPDPRHTTIANPSSAGGPDPVSVSAPGYDLLVSRLEPDQNESSTAWCGKHIVVGFNDGDSLAETFISASGGDSVDGYALSTNRGLSFRDELFLPPFSHVDSILEGDPVLACKGSTFLFSTLFFDADTTPNPTSGASVSVSTDGGVNFSQPTPAIALNANTDFVDKDWMAIDPANPAKVYVSFTDFDMSGTVCGKDGSGNVIPGTSIKVVTSSDGATTFGAPVSLTGAPVCVAAKCPTGDCPFVQGSQLVVSPPGAAVPGQINAAWESIGADAKTREIDFAVSTDGGVTFRAPAKAEQVSCVGDCTQLQGGIRITENPSLAVSKTGVLYMAWNDGNAPGITPPPDDLSVTGVYGFGSILVSRSLDSGATWSNPVTVRAIGSFGSVTDRFEPAIAVTRFGRVGVCFYDRSNDRRNFRIDRACASSINGGKTFSSTRITGSSFAPIVEIDSLGDYDTLAVDSNGTFGGFFGGFTDTIRNNQDIFGNPF